MPLIKQSQEAIEKTEQWLDHNAPDFVNETFISLLKALTSHQELAYLQSDLDETYADLIDDLFDFLPTQDMTDDDKSSITTKVTKLSETSQRIKLVSNF